MRKLKYLLIIPLFFLASCSEEKETELEAFNPEAFAFDIGGEYEVNSTVRVKGFRLSGQEEQFTASVAYELDLVKPDGTTEEAVISRVEDLSFKEKVHDAAIEIQFTLDSTYAPGKYKLVYNLKDTYTNKTASASAEFELGD